MDRIKNMENSFYPACSVILYYLIYSVLLNLISDDLILGYV